MVDDAARAGRRLRFDCLDVAVLCQAGARLEDAPPVGGLGLHGEDFRHRHDQIGFADVPAIRVVELARRRHVGGVAARRAGGRPRGERFDLPIGERRVVLELPDADGPIDVPRRHLPRFDALLDRASPGTCVLVGQQRHRRDRTGAMAVLAGFLEDRRHVFRERDLGRRGRCGRDDAEKERDGVCQERAGLSRAADCSHTDLRRDYSRA